MAPLRAARRLRRQALKRAAEKLAHSVAGAREPRERREQQQQQGEKSDEVVERQPSGLAKVLVFPALPNRTLERLTEGEAAEVPQPLDKIALSAAS